MATAAKLSSAHGSPANWTPKGSPCASRPEGRFMAGNPEKLQGTLAAADPVDESPSGAVLRDAGINAASTVDRIRNISD